MKTRAADDRVSHESRFQDALFHPFVDKVDDADVFRTVAAKDFHVRFAVVLTLVELNNSQATIFHFIRIHARFARFEGKLFENIVLGDFTVADDFDIAHHAARRKIEIYDNLIGIVWRP